MYNTIIAIGHLVKDPETRTTSTGKAICTFRICISESQAKNKCFIDVETWERTAEVCQKYLAKGREAMIEGELSTSTWTGKDGNPQSKNFIRATKVKFLGGGQKNDAAKDDSNTSSKQVSESSNDSEDEDIPF
jgi:single-strand DNA-binding protein